MSSSFPSSPSVQPNGDDGGGGNNGGQEGSSGRRRKRQPNSNSRIAVSSPQSQHIHANPYGPGSPQTPPSKIHASTSNKATPDAFASSTAAAATPAMPSSAQRGPSLTVLVHRVDLYDSGDGQQQQQQRHASQSYPVPHQTAQTIAPYSFDAAAVPSDSEAAARVAIVRVAPEAHQHRPDPMWQCMPRTKAKCPFDYDAKLSKYWHQRHRLFSRFDDGIQLDDEGWFSVTPEQIANHVAGRLQELIVQQLQQQQQQQQAALSTPGGAPTAVAGAEPFVLLDAFGGCGGNSIAFAKVPQISAVVCVDVDREKLRRAAHNAALYGIPTNKIVFVECNVLFILEYCYRNGQFCLDMAHSSAEAAMAMMDAMPPPVDSEVVEGYSVGGIDLLPRFIHAVFMDPPWGGVDYAVLGKQGYDLEKNMRIERPKNQNVTTAAEPCTSDGAAMSHDFFDTFLSEPRSKQERISQFNIGKDVSNCVNGVDLLRLAARATPTRTVLYDVPRNTSRLSIGKAAVQAGYRGNCKLEEHYLNGRLKTVTAYFGSDWRFLLPN